MPCLSNWHRKVINPPPTVYRALDFLQAQGLAHKVNALNAYLGCSHPQSRDQNRLLLICRFSGNVAELHRVKAVDPIESITQPAAFHIEQQVLEILDVCQQCAQENDEKGVSND